MARATLPGLLIGTRYMVQLRAKNEFETSEWSPVFDFVTDEDHMAPAPITDLVVTPAGRSFIITWKNPTTNADGTPLRDLRDVWLRIEGLDGTGLSAYGDFFVSAPGERFEFTQDMNMQLFGRLRVQCSIRVTGFARDIKLNVSTPTVAIGVRGKPNPPVNVGFKPGPLLIMLDWDDPQGDFDGYVIYHSKTGIDFPLIPENLVRSVTDSFYDFTTTDSDMHYFAIATIGVCGQYSDFVRLAAKTEPMFEVDTKAPPQIKNVKVTTVAVETDKTGANCAIQMTWDTFTPSDDVTDLDHYEIRYTTNPSNISLWQSQNVIRDAVSALITGLLPNTKYYFQIRAVDFTGNDGTWAIGSPYPITTITDQVAPSKPSRPTVAGSAQRVMVEHDLTKAEGGLLEADLHHLEVYIDKSKTNFRYNDETRIGTILCNSPSLGVPAIETFPYPTTDEQTNRYVCVAAVDGSGNRSDFSDIVDVTINLITSAFIEDATIEHAKIKSVRADSIIAGTGIINDLSVNATLTVGSVDSFGYIQSYEWQKTGGLAGFRLDRGGLTIIDGKISAKSIELQSSANLLAPQWASFEAQSWLYGQNVQQVIVNGLATYSNFGKSEATARYGKASLRIDKGGADAPGNNINIPLANNFSDYNVNVDPVARYIYSIWVSVANVEPAGIKLCYKTNDGTFANVQQQTYTKGPGNWWRVYGFIDTDANARPLLPYIEVTQNGSWFFDGAQFELKTGATNLPSEWEPPGITSIDGGVITTGEIRSAYPAAGMPDRPAWSINLLGEAFFGSAWVLGQIVVGHPTEPRLSRIVSNGFVSGSKGWQIDGYGNAEFNNATVRGTIHATGGDFTGDVRVGMGNNNFIASQNWVPGGIGWMLRGDGYGEISNVMVKNLTVLGQSVVGGVDPNTMATSDIRSGNYSGSSGWIIRGNGTAEFNQVNVRGNITGSLITGSRFIGTAFATAPTSVERMGFSSEELDLSSVPAGWDSTEPHVIWASRFNTLNARIRYNTPTLSFDFYSARRMNFEIGQGTNVAQAGDSIQLNAKAGGQITLRAGFLTAPLMGTTNAGTPIVMGSSPVGILLRNTSSRRYKTDINDLAVTEDDIMALRPVTFYNVDDLARGNERLGMGLIAEEVAESDSEVVQQLAVYNDDGLPDAVTYDRVGVILTPIVQTHITKIKELEDRVRELESRLS